MPNISDTDLEVAARDSWDAWYQKDPLKDWGLTCQNLPEIAEAHKGLVRAMFTTNFNPEKAIGVSSEGKYQFTDLFERGREFHVFLGKFLKEWAESRG